MTGRSAVERESDSADFFFRDTGSILFPPEPVIRGARSMLMIEAEIERFVEPPECKMRGASRVIEVNKRAGAIHEPVATVQTSHRIGTS